MGSSVWNRQWRNNSSSVFSRFNIKEVWHHVRCTSPRHLYPDGLPHVRCDLPGHMHSSRHPNVLGLNPDWLTNFIEYLTDYRGNPIIEEPINQGPLCTCTVHSILHKEPSICPTHFSPQVTLTITIKIQSSSASFPDSGITNNDESSQHKVSPPEILELTAHKLLNYAPHDSKRYRIIKQGLPIMELCMDSFSAVTNDPKDVKPEEMKLKSWERELTR